jgi:hypothetical protein
VLKAFSGSSLSHSCPISHHLPAESEIANIPSCLFLQDVLLSNRILSRRVKSCIESTHRIMPDWERMMRATGLAGKEAEDYTESPGGLPCTAPGVDQDQRPVIGPLPNPQKESHNDSPSLFWHNPTT